MDNWSTYRHPAPPLRDLGLACLGAGEQGGQLPSFAGRTLSSHALVLVSEGSGHFSVDGRRFEVQAPAIIWLFPGVSHGYGPGPRGWKEHWLLFTGPTARALEELGSYSRAHPILQLDDPSESGLVEALGLFPALRAALSVGGHHSDVEASVLCQRVLSEAGKLRSQGHRGIPGRTSRQAPRGGTPAAHPRPAGRPPEGFSPRTPAYSSGRNRGGSKGFSDPAKDVPRTVAPGGHIPPRSTNRDAHWLRRSRLLQPALHAEDRLFAEPLPQGAPEG